MIVISEYPKIVFARLSEVQRMQLDAMAATHGLTASAVVRQALTEMWQAEESTRIEEEYKTHPDSERGL